MAEPEPHTRKPVIDVAAPRPLSLLRWPVLTLLAAAALGLGCVGFEKHFDALGAPRPPLDLLYLSLQLFVLESGSVAGPIPWELELGRLLAPAVTGYAAFLALATIFAEERERLRIRFQQGHVIVCGLGRKGLVLTRSLLAAGERVVVIERNPENFRLASCRRDGALVLIGDARDRQCLQAAAVERARTLVAISESDGTNAEIAIRARELSAGRSRSLGCIAQIVDPKLAMLLRMQEMERRPEPAFQLDFFNVFESGARQLLDEWPPSAKEGGAGHILVVGLGRFGSAVVREAVRRSASAQTKPTRLKITVVDRTAAAKAARLQIEHPDLARICELVAKDLELESPAFHRGEFLPEPGGAPQPTAAYVCLDDDSLGFASALVLHRHLKERRTPVIVRMSQGGGLASLLREDDAEREFESLHVFSLLERTCRRDLVLGGTIETIARALHEERVRQEEAKGGTAEADASLAHWQALPEALRASSRERARNLGVMLRAVGCELSPLSRLDGPELPLSPEEIARLAELEEGGNHLSVRGLPGILASVGLEITRLR